MEDKMTAETVKMSSRGQIVIPQEMREEIKAGEGTVFSVVSAKDAIILKKIATPSKEDLIKELEAIASEGRKRAEKAGIKESDVPELIRTARKSRQHENNRRH
ncbi:AbrB/MazE/SpoVT family DNA-binding domain-containing protein [Candidatus Woesearchaeota archaeon]|nr:AbrB/MazE/SpoVT family DNA-binding domain-containing protein [Candidatus Woesearchaeota archaeon]